MKEVKYKITSDKNCNRCEGKMGLWIHRVYTYGHYEDVEGLYECCTINCLGPIKNG